MPVIQKEVSIAAGGVNDNLFSGSAYEFARFNSLISVGLAAAATGTFAQLQAGPEIVAEEFAPPVLTRYPIIPDEFYYNAVMVTGDRLVLGRVRWRCSGGSRGGDRPASWQWGARGRPAF